MEVKEKEYEPTSTVMLLIPFLPGDDDVPFTSATQLAHYVKVKLAEYNKKVSPSGPSFNNKNYDGLNRPGEDPHEQILSNADELAKLTKLKKSLKKFYTQLTIQGNQDDVSWPDVFSHILESMVTDRIRYIYKKNEERLLEVYKTLYNSLMGLVNNQILLVHENMLWEFMKSTP